MDDKNHRIATDFNNLLMQLNQKIPAIGFNDEGKADAIFIETRELIKKHFGEEHGYYKDFLRVRKLTGAYTYQLQNLLPVVEVIANRAKEDYLATIEEFQQQILEDDSKNASTRIPWKELDKREKKYRTKKPLSPKLKGLFRNSLRFLFDAHNLKVFFLVALGIGLCSIPFFFTVIPNWLGYVSGIIVAIVGTLFTMTKKGK